MQKVRKPGYFLNWMDFIVRRAAMLSLVVLSLQSFATKAQTPAPAAASFPEKQQEGFYPGWGFGTRFEGSTSGDGSVYDIATGVGYNFSHHFGVDLGVPYNFVGTPSSIKQKNAQAVSGDGLGNLGADLKWIFPGKALTYASTVHLGAPTGDIKKGFGTGHATWNWTNHLEHGFGNFTPFIDGGAGNSVLDSRYFHRPFTTFGYNAQFEAGTEIDAGPLSLTASAYDVAPWGTQTVVSKLFRCSSGAKCSAGAKSTNRKNYLNSNITTGDASLTRDNGFNAGVEYKPAKFHYLDFELDYSRSVPLRLNNISFGVAVDIGGMIRSR
jgi:hypothetical protein